MSDTPARSKVELEAIPFVDRHGFRTTTSPEQVWAALAPTLMASFGTPHARLLARLLGCRERRQSRPFLLEAGDTLVGFRVLHADRPHEVTLEGKHRFSHYVLVFQIGSREGITAVSAETRAGFPAGLGMLYRALIVGTGIHAWIMRRMLSGLRRRAEQDRRPLRAGRSSAG